MSITLTRQQLYDRVWADPIHTLLKEFGYRMGGTYLRVNGCRGTSRLN